MNNTENPVIAIAAWRNPKGTKAPLSVMFEQQFGNSSFINWKLGKRSRRVRVESFSESRAKDFGIDFATLGEGSDNRTEINVNLNEISGLPMRITLLETTDEDLAKREYYTPKTFGEGGIQCATPDGEPIYHTYRLTEGDKDQTLEYVPMSAVTAKPAAVSANAEVF
jgi:hypothetical protein